MCKEKIVNWFSDTHNVLLVCSAVIYVFTFIILIGYISHKNSVIWHSVMLALLAANLSLNIISRYV